MSNIYHEWLKAANDDLILINKIIGDKELTHLAAFHSQQVIEKALKGLMEYHNRDVPKIHSQNRLFKLCEDYIAVEDLNVVNTLDSLYIEARYPGDLGLLPDGKPGIDDAIQFYHFAKTVFDKINRLITETGEK